MITIGVLGPLEVAVDGAAAHVGGPRQRCVLARLIAARGQVVSADRLIEDLYADEAPPRALAAVQSYVSHLRRALEPGRAAWDRAGVLVAAPPGYALRLGDDAVDAWSFEKEVHLAAGLQEAGPRHALLSTALARWKGTAFQEFGDLPWAGLEAARLDELRLTAHEMLAQAALRLGRATQVIGDLDRLTTEHPLREEGWRLLALALYQSGRQGDALGVLRRARARLAADLGIDPGPALRTLESDILAQAPHLSQLPAAPPGTSPADVYAPAASDLPPLISESYLGRDAELGQVRHAAAAAAAGRLRIVLVSGDAGAGKTALGDRVSEGLAASGWVVTAGRCPEHEGAPAGWPWAEALRRLARITPPTEPRPLAALLTDSLEAAADAAAARFRLHRAVGAYLGEVSGAAPLLVVLDDLHRADGETLALLADVIAGLPTARILMLGSYRPGEVTEQLSECLASLAVRQPAWVTLRGLDAAAAGELIRATCTRPVDEPTKRAIAERTGGNPFLIKETARLLDSEGAVAATSQVPAGVREVLERRVARLPATAQTILRQASVIGTETGVDVLGDIADVGEDVLLEAIEAGLLTGLVTEPAVGRIRFAHDLVRDTLYHGLSRLRRARLHARAAAAIERHAPGEVAALAHHFTMAGTDPAKAARYCFLAATQARQRFAFHEAERLWERAVAFLGEGGGAPARDRLEAALGLVGALADIGDLPRTWRRDAVRAALPLDNAELLARVITAFDRPWLYFAHRYGETDHELVSTVEQTLARLPPGDHPLSCRLLATLAFELEGDYAERGYQASAQAVEMARRLGDRSVLTIAIIGRYFQNYRHDDLTERKALAEELLALPGNPMLAEMLARLLLTAASSGAADFGAADRHASECARIAESCNFPRALSISGLYQAMRAALNGDLTTAAESYRRVAAEIDRAVAPWRHGTAMNAMGRFTLLIMQDRLAELAGEYNGSPLAGVTFTEVHALTLAACGRTADARDLAGRLPLIRPDRFWLFRTAVRGLLAIALDDRERAKSAYRALLPYAARPAGADAMLPLWPVAQILGDLAGYLGLPDAEAHYLHALAVAEQAGVGSWREAALRRLNGGYLSYRPAAAGHK